MGSIALSVLGERILRVDENFDATYWSLVIAVVAAFCLWQFGSDPTSNALLAAAGCAATLACWRRTQHFAQWLSGGSAAVSGALLTLILEAAMNGGASDPSTTPLLLSFMGAASTSAVLHNRIAQAQIARDRELDAVLASLPTLERLHETEGRLSAVLEMARPTPASSWGAWWRERPLVRR